MSDELNSQSGTNADLHHHADGSNQDNLVQRPRSPTRDAPSGQQTTSTLAESDGCQIIGASGTTNTAPARRQPPAQSTESGTLSPSRIEESIRDEPTSSRRQRPLISADPSGGSTDGSSQNQGGSQPAGYVSTAGSAFPKSAVQAIQEQSLQRVREDSMEPGVGSRANSPENPGQPTSSAASPKPAHDKQIPPNNDSGGHTPDANNGSGEGSKKE